MSPLEGHTGAPPCLGWLTNTGPSHTDPAPPACNILHPFSFVKNTIIGLHPPSYLPLDCPLPAEGGATDSLVTVLTPCDDEARGARSLEMNNDDDDDDEITNFPCAMHLSPDDIADDTSCCHPWLHGQDSGYSRTLHSLLVPPEAADLTREILIPSSLLRRITCPCLADKCHPVLLPRQLYTDTLLSPSCPTG